MMQVRDLRLRGLKLINPDRYEDERGWFAESFNATAFEALGLPRTFAQDNVSLSQHGVLRGLHLQARQPQGKLVRVVRGRIWDVMVDLRPTSSTLGQWTAVELAETGTGEGLELLWIPEGFAHGFLVLSEQAEVTYKVTRPYDPGGEQTLLWNDPELAIAWPLERLERPAPIVSAKDRAGLSLAELLPSVSAR